MLEAVLTVPFWLEFAAALTGGVSGAMSAVRARYDIFGTVSLACICGLFGGILRDILLLDYGIYAFQRPELIVACAISGVLVFFFGKLISYLDPVVRLLDNLSASLWTVISVGKGLLAGVGFIPSIVLGTITAIGGGLARDVIMNREPAGFQTGTLYGSASLIGSIVYATMSEFHFLEQWAPFICVGVVLAIRYASLLFGWETKPPHDYSDTVAKAVVKPVKTVAHIFSPPKGKIEREKERWRQVEKMNSRRKKPQESGVPENPSDRILINLDELREVSSTVKDPFEPSTPDPKKYKNKRDS